MCGDAPITGAIHFPTLIVVQSCPVTPNPRRRKQVDHGSLALQLAEAVVQVAGVADTAGEPPGVDSMDACESTFYLTAQSSTQPVMLSTAQQLGSRPVVTSWQLRTVVGAGTGDADVCERIAAALKARSCARGFMLADENQISKLRGPQAFVCS